MNQIAQRLQITHGALYKHFPNKQALWEAVTQQWFEQTILEQLPQPDPQAAPKQQLHDWLWALVNAKKATYHSDAQLFVLNTQYVDNNPAALRQVLTGAEQTIITIMGYSATEQLRAEAIIAAFAIFMLPNFRETWDDPDYAQRFETTWALISAGL